MVVDAFAQALMNFLSPALWLFMGMGIVVGLVVGVIPTTGSLLALSLVLPFLFAREAEV